MPIVAADIEYALSINDGPGNSEPQPDPNDSLGGWISQTLIVNATLHNLFGPITGPINAAETPDYRCFFAHNTHATLTWFGARVWVQSQVAGGAVAAIGLDPVGIVPVGDATQQAERIADAFTAPSAAFSTPTDYAGGLVVGDVPPGECFAVWVRRTPTNSLPIDVDGVVIRVQGDTGA